MYTYWFQDLGATKPWISTNDGQEEIQKAGLLVSSQYHFNGFDEAIEIVLDEILETTSLAGPFPFSSLLYLLPSFLEKLFPPSIDPSHASKSLSQTGIQGTWSKTLVSTSVP